MIVVVSRLRGFLASFAGLFPTIGRGLYGSMRAKGQKQQRLMQQQAAKDEVS